MLLVGIWSKYEPLKKGIFELVWNGGSIIKSDGIVRGQTCNDDESSD